MNDIVKLNEIIVWCLNSEYLLVRTWIFKDNYIFIIFTSEIIRLGWVRLS